MFYKLVGIITFFTVHASQQTSSSSELSPYQQQLIEHRILLQLQSLQTSHQNLNFQVKSALNKAEQELDKTKQELDKIKQELSAQKQIGATYYRFMKYFSEERRRLTNQNEMVVQENKALRAALVVLRQKKP
jgi:hypothetical protein